MSEPIVSVSLYIDGVAEISIQGTEDIDADLALMKALDPVRTLMVAAVMDFVKVGEKKK